MLDEIKERWIGTHCAIRLDVQSISSVLERLAQRNNVLAQCFSSSDTHPFGRMLLDFRDDFFDRPLFEGVKLGIAEGTPQIASR